MMGADTMSQFLFPDDHSPDDLDENGQSAAAAEWKVLVVDDEPDMHDLTRLILGGVRFLGRPLRIFEARSAAEAWEIITKHPDMAAVVLDVVMETDDAGLRLVTRIREDLDNKVVRIIMRTGQPGMAPEQQVVRDYDIHDYIAKAEASAARLFTSITGALRAYDDIRSTAREVIRMMQQHAPPVSSRQDQLIAAVTDLKTLAQQMQKLAAELELTFDDIPQQA